MGGIENWPGVRAGVRAGVRVLWLFNSSVVLEFNGCMVYKHQLIIRVCCFEIAILFEL